MNRRQFISSAAGLGVAAGLTPSFAKSDAPDSEYQQSNISQFTGEVLFTVDYQERDDQIVDYSNYELEYLPGLRFRGPALDLASQEGYITCLGAAQTHGVFVDNPYPQLLSQKYGLPVWNLGVGGGHPGFFLEHPELFEFINKSRFVVLQVMTGRCSANDRMGRSHFSAAGFDKKYEDHVSGSVIWNRVMKEEPENAERYLAQSLASWREDLEQLVANIDVPILHFWFSPKPLEQNPASTVASEARKDIAKLDQYPQLISANELEVIDGQPFAACHSNRNMRFPLRSKHTGEIVNLNWGAIRHKMDFDWYETHNLYYPSPEMQWDAMEVLSQSIDEYKLLS